MAISDEDWRKFVDATEEDSEEVETDDKSEDENDDDAKGDDKDDTKKSKQDEGDADDDSGEDDKKSDSEEDDDDDKKKSQDDSYKPRLKQFLNDDGTLNAEKIEKSYVESGKQAVELNGKLEESNKNYSDLLGAIKANPKAAILLFGEEAAKKFINDDSIQTGSNANDKGTGDLSQNPLIRHLSAQMTRTSKSEYNDFVKAHPESVTDPEKARQIGVFLKQHGAIYREENDGEIPSMKESLEAAYRYYGWDLEIKNKNDVANAAKNSAATRATPQGGHKASKKEVSQGEQFFAQKLGVKLK